MKLVNILRAMATACALFTAAHASSAPVLLVVSNGILTGAKNVDVAGTLYDVTLLEGSCDTLFNGCDNSAFTFTTSASARVAAQALLDSVFVDGSLGQFDSNPKTILGCKTVDICIVAIPFLFEVDQDWRLVIAGVAVNTAAGSRYVDRASVSYFDADSSGRSFAQFQLASPDASVPEPTSIGLFGLAMAGLAFNRRRKA